MKCCWKKILKIVLALAVLSAAVFTVVQFWDSIMDVLTQIRDKAKALCCKDCGCEEAE